MTKARKCACGLLAGMVLALPGWGIDVRVDFTHPLGRDIRRLNGGNLGPSLTESGLIRDTRQEFASLRIPLTRTHDATLGNPGLRLCDVQMIFGNAKADAADPDNYYFKATDDYLRSILDAGSEVLFRLGTSIEHSRTHYATEPMMSNEKWAEVCAGIIRHYNRGWADGHRWNIRYWEIWNEADTGSPMWSKTFKDYLLLYETAARRIKQEFPDVKVGGPALARFHPTLSDPGRPDSNGHVFLSFCRERKCPLDFFSWHWYNMTLPELLTEPAAMRKVVDSYGFKQTELILDEWHYWCGRFDKLGQNDPEVGLSSANAVVHALAALTGWQDSPLDQACFYTIGPYFDGWGAWDSCLVKTRTFSAFRMFANMLDFPHRVAVESPDVNVQVLAGRADDGRRAVLVSNFKSGADEIRLTLRGAESTTFGVTCLDKDNDDLRYDVTVPPDGTVVLRAAAPRQSNAYLLYEYGGESDGRFFFSADNGGSIGVCAPAAVGTYSLHKLPAMPVKGRLRLHADMKSPQTWGGRECDGTTLRVGLMTTAGCQAKGRWRETLGEVGPDFNRGVHCFGMTKRPDGTYTGKIVGNQRPGIWYRYQVEYDLDAKTYSFKVFEGGATMMKRGGAVGRLVGETDGMPFLGTLSVDSGPISHVALYAHGLAGTQEQSGYFANISVEVPEGDGWRTVWSGTDDLGACDSFSMKSSW